MGPASARGPASPTSQSTPREHLGPAPAYPGAGHVYRLRTVVRRGSGLPRAQPHSRLVPLIHCRQRHRRWARRAAGIALHQPPWPPPPPSVSAKALVAAATATAATGSPRRLRASRPARPQPVACPAPVHPAARDRISLPPRGYYSWRETNSCPVKAALHFHWRASQ